ncbi:MAG: hypothetical protein JRJ77_13340 [Deltaproteobacteria bacterium]|nr:hypothetical protein [Deltaproteobacteria bacterium]MBW2341772.1 hypothetical protein [Deltaproteobacteria bacterium]
MKKSQEVIKEERKIILEMINASCELAERLGEHLLKSGCNCLVCVNRRKRMLDERNVEWKFRL